MKILTTKPCLRGRPILAGFVSFAAFGFAAASTVDSGSKSPQWEDVVAKVSGADKPSHRTILKRLGADVFRRLPIISSVALRIRADKLPELEALNWVRHVSPDNPVLKYDAFTVGSSYANVAANAYGVSGFGVAVAILDSGVQNQADFGDPAGCRLKQSVSFVKGEDVNDHCGHGTHVGGIVAGNGQASTGSQFTKTFYGIAPRANLINVKVINSQGAGTVSQVVAGIQWCLQNQSRYNIRVINLSLGHPVSESYAVDPLCQAVEQAYRAGIVVVCAAGNAGRLNSAPTNGAPNGGYGTAYGSVECPGNDPYVITVGATKSIDGQRQDDQVATYSSRGPTYFDYVLKPDIVAPGNKVISVEASNTFLVNSYLATNGVPYNYYETNQSNTAPSNKYYVLSGTSMAAPVASGAVALMLQAQPSLTPDMVKARLMMSADKWADPWGVADPCSYGAGYLDIPAALSCTATPTQSVMSPTMSQDGCGNVFINLDGSIWGQRAIWGTGITDLRAIWGNRAIWGFTANLVSSSRALWGNSFWSYNNSTSITSAGVDLSSNGVAVTGE